jgi:DNA topoisomerase-1
MSKTLVVVESPSKAKKIGQMLGANFVVQASGGHIRDLPVRTGENGYDDATLEPVYEVTERGKDSVKYLKSKLAACDKVLLATDPDREGEAIAWHVAEVLRIKKADRMRVKFHEITASAIIAAVKNPTPLEINLVRAQEARRVIDRLVGWMVSSPLSRAINEKASAGRVQSPSLGLVVERERQIKSFVKELSFSVKTAFAPDWSAEWATGDAKCKVRGEAERAAAVKSFLVKEYIEKDEAEAPPPPFDTALMQQAASVALQFDPEKTMAVAQKLFEGGHITYHRTDEANLSDDAFAMITDWAGQHGLPVVSSRRKFKAAVGSQEAHEAIRPTHFDTDHSALSGDELALYQLIHRRAVASQLDDVVYSVRRAKLEGDGMMFNAVGRIIKSKGWRAYGVAAEIEEEDKDEIPANSVPTLTVGQPLTATGSRVIESWSRSPGRYTKASLIKTLKALGIGRPATYAAAVDGLEKRGYVSIEKRQLVPTPVAEKIYDALTGKFAFINVDFTRNLESDLDAITQGRKTYTEVVRAMHNVLKAELAALGVAGVPVKREPAIDATGQSVKCPKCEKSMLMRNGTRGAFYGCSGYPKCNGSRPAALSTATPNNA